MPADSAGFLPLAQFLRTACAPPPSDAAAEVSEADRAIGPALDVPTFSSLVEAGPCPCQSAVRDVRLFRAAVSDALDAILGDLVQALADEVVARELRLAPVEIATLARTLVAQRMHDEPVRLRVAPDDAALAVEVPVVADPALARGDAVLECRSGAVDARLAIRVAAVVRRFAS